MTVEPDLESPPVDEAGRLAAVHDLQVLDTPPEQVFDDFVWLAAELCRAPIAMVNLIDADRQWTKASCGIEAGEAPRADSYCTHAIGHDGLLEVPDSWADSRFASSPFSRGDAPLRFYAGAPLVGGGGQCYGTLCVADTVPRSLTETQREGLLRLAQRVVHSLEERRDRLQAEAREQMLSRLLEAMPDAVVACDATGLLKHFNAMARDWHGTDVRTLLPDQWPLHFDLYGPDGAGRLATDQVPLYRAWRGESIRDVEIVIRARGQPPRTVLCNAEPLRTPRGAMVGAVCIMRDVTAQRVAEAGMRVSEARLRTIADNIPAFIAHVDADLRYRFLNEQYRRVLRVDPVEAVGQHMRDVIGEEAFAQKLPYITRVLGGERVEFERWIQMRTGEREYASVTFIPDAGHADGRPCGFYVMSQDMTSHRLLAETMHERALCDALTGLPNRVAWEDELGRGLSRASRGGSPLAVMFLDLDGFKQVNDLHGHAAGDAVLREFARRLKGAVRRSDFVARLAGDEFVVLLERMADAPVDLPRIAGKILQAMQAPVALDELVLRMTPSIGIALGCAQDVDAAWLMAVADEAMYAAKRAPGGKGYVLRTC